MRLEQFPQSAFRKNYQMIAEENRQGTGTLLNAVHSLSVWPKECHTEIDELETQFTRWWIYDVYERYNRAVGYPTSALPTLYFLSRDVLGPLKMCFTTSVLKEASALNAQVLFLARDGFSEFIMAKMQEKLCKEKINAQYLPVSVKMMRKIHESADSKEMVKAYLQQYGLGKVGIKMLVDIGFTGEIPHLISELFPESADSIYTRFLISRVTPSVELQRPVMKNASGFLFDQQRLYTPELESLLNRVEIMRALEDTWGGLKTSARELESSSSGTLRAKTSIYDDSFEQKKRVVAMMGIRDAARIAYGQNFEVDECLERKSQYVRNFTDIFTQYANDDLLEVLCSPHEPTNF